MGGTGGIADDVEKPVFIIGCPRSGTTVFLDVLAIHEDFGWVSQHLDLRPDQRWRAAINRIYQLPVLGERLYRHREQIPKAPVAAEPWIFFDHYLSRFKPKTYSTEREIPRGPMADDMTAAEARAIRGAVADLLRRQRRTQFVSKYTDYPRISYLTKAFPDARFVHITRDGRGVAHSYAKKMRSGSFGTWDERDLWIQALDEDSQERWAKIDQSPLALGLLLWKYFIGEIRNDAANVAPEQYLEVRYADLVSRPRELLSDVFDFCGMDWTPRFTRELDHLELTDMNRKWRTELSEDERVLLDELVVEPELRELFDPS